MSPEKYTEEYFATKRRSDREQELKPYVIAYINRSLFHTAEVLVRELISLNRNSDNLNNLAHCVYNIEKNKATPDYSESDILLDESISAENRSFWPLLTKAEVSMSKGDKMEAIRYIELGIAEHSHSEQPDNSAIHKILAAPEWNDIEIKRIKEFCHG